MKVAEAFCIFAMVGLCKAGSGKLLKTPRIYNAFVTSDEKLLPSQAYPAIAPVVHGIHYPIASYIATPGLYHPIIPIPAFSSPVSAVSHVSPVTGGRSYSYAVKQDYYSYNYFENEPALGAKVPLVQDPTQPFIYMPVGLQPLQPKLAAPYPAAEVRGDGKTEFEEEQPQQQQDKAEAEQGEGEFEEANSVAVRKGQRNPAPRLRGQPTYPQQKPPPQQKAPEQQTYDESEAAADDADEPGTEGEGEEGEAADQPVGPLLVKNNRPKDPSIVDVPPEPLPIGTSKGKKKKPEEYPPSPVAFV